MDTITREQKLYAIAGANLLWIIALFFPWAGVDVDVPDVPGIDLNIDTSANGWDLIPSAWIFLAIAAIAGLAAVAEAMDYELPLGLPALPVAFGGSALGLLETVAVLLDIPDGLDMKWGIFLALAFSVIAILAAVLVWREDR